MPELPEVETTVKGLREAIVGEVFGALWTDWPKVLEVLAPRAEGQFARTSGLTRFKNALLGRKILAIDRRAKFVALRLSGPATLLIHMKLTGHLLIGRWRRVNKIWRPEAATSAMADRWNSYLRWVASFRSGKMLGFSDLRRFGRFRLILGDLDLSHNHTGIKELDTLGPEPLTAEFAFGPFWHKIKRRRVAIKKILLDQSVVAGLGNIYVDEILWHTQVNPLVLGQDLTQAAARRIYQFIPEILTAAISNQGSTIGDYKKTDGTAGAYQKSHQVYQRHKAPCRRCGTLIERTVVGGRGTHFCPKCQK